MAAHFDRSSHTIDGWLRQAIKTLKVGSRDEAAQLLARYEGFEPTQRLIGQSLSMEKRGPFSETLRPSDEKQPRLDEDFIVCEPPMYWPAHARDALQSEPPSLERTTKLSSGAKLVAIALIAIVAMLAFGALLAGITALSTLV